MLVQGSHSIAMFAAHALRESNSHVHIRCKYNTRIQYRRPFPYLADRSALCGKDRLHCMHMPVE